MPLLVCLLVFASKFLTPQSGNAPGPRVTTDSGVIEGSSADPSKQQAIFLGIPFAAPPVGDFRWRPPQPVELWTGIRSAKHFAPSCPQLPSSWWPEMAGREQLDVSEDCLYLNVWTDHFDQAAKIPVLVWIHGGGNVEGSSQIPQLGPALAHKGVVVVSVDYRLGVLGFFAHPALSAESSHHTSGNYGLLDQIAALAWIQKNIAAFGGDPNRVTTSASPAVPKMFAIFSSRSWPGVCSMGPSWKVAFAWTRFIPISANRKTIITITDLGNA